MATRGGGIDPLPVSPDELEFFAEEERVTVIPNFTSDAYECISGAHGPFRPNVPCAVPLWLALYLHRRAKCRLVPPPWLSPSRLERTVRAEQEDGSAFQPVPFYYMEVACLLFEHAREAFGADFARVRSLLARLANIRRHKIEDGLRQVQAAVTVRLNHLSAFEANLIRPSFQGALGAFDRLERQEAAWAEAAAAAAAAAGGGGGYASQGARNGGAFASRPPPPPGAAASPVAAGCRAVSTTAAPSSSDSNNNNPRTPRHHHRHAYASHSAGATLGTAAADGPAAGTRVVFETGRLARQAGGAVLLRHGCGADEHPGPSSSAAAASADPAARATRGTVVLATACMAEGRAPLREADGPQLQVDVRERFYASGRLPTHRADRREASASERELLAARCVDRALRPLFHPGAMYEVQVTATVLACDGGTDAAVAAINAASAALALSEAPWSGPASAVRVAAVRSGRGAGSGGGGQRGGGGGGGKSSTSGGDEWEIVVDPPAAAIVGAPLPRRAGPAAPWPMLTPGPLLMAAAAAGGTSLPSGGRHSQQQAPPPPQPCGLLLTYAGTAGGDVLMLEAQGAPAPEAVVIAALRRAQREALLLAEPQLALVTRAGRPKARLPLVWPADELSRAVEELARPGLEAIFSGAAAAAPAGGSGGGGGGRGSAAAEDPWAAAPWQTAKERRAAALGELQGRVMRGLVAQGLLPDAHSLLPPASASSSSSSSSSIILHAPADAARALDLLTSRVMREALLAGCGAGTGLVDARSSVRPSAVLPPSWALASPDGGGDNDSSSSSPKLGRRADGRWPWDLRHVRCETGVLPRAVHGSALFDRGDTQCLAAATVAAERDAAQAESPHGRTGRRLMLHYSFPPFSVGEVGRLMGAPPNRREVGHGALAEKALAPLMPPADAFPFCVRVSAETLGSSGSSSMAAVCAGSAAMRAAGVPLSDDAAGVSVGLAYERAPQLERGGWGSAGEAAVAYGRGGGGGAEQQQQHNAEAAAADAAADAGEGEGGDSDNDDDGSGDDEAQARRRAAAAAAAAAARRHLLPVHPRYGRGALLTDIEGLEDHHGDMDFKIAGTAAGGVTAMQLDTKLPGVPREALERALLGPALSARRAILRRTLRAQHLGLQRLPGRARPKAGSVSLARELVPRLVGAGGCNLESIEAATGGRLAVSEGGEVAIYAPTAAQWDHAATAVLEVEGGSIVEGGVYRVKAVRVVDYGAFVSLPNGMPALLHISELEHRRLRDVHEAVKEGDEFDVVCLGRDSKGMVQLSRRALLPRPPSPAPAAARPAAVEAAAPAATTRSGGDTSDGSTQQSVWTLPSDRQYTPEEAAAAAEAALGLKQEEEGEGEDKEEEEASDRAKRRPRRR